MKILIAGGCGYVGSHLIPLLIERDYDIEVVDLLWFGNHLPRDIKVTKKNIFDLSIVDLEGFDQVIFLAGLSNDPMADFSPAINFKYNAALPSYLAYMAKQAGVKRYIYASSCSVYGYTVNELYDEESPTICNYPYGISKLQGEKGVMQLQDDTFSVIALRQGTICGYSPRMRFDLIVNAMFKDAVTTNTITVNNPALWRPILDIRDAGAAYLRAIQADYGISGVFNVASDNYTVGSVGDIVKDCMGDIKLIIKDIDDCRNYKVNIDKARVYLGFQPQYMARDTVNNINTKCSAYPDFEDDNYYNIRVFKKSII